MKIRATLRIRNDAMIAAREAKGMSQADVAAVTGVPCGALQRLERLDFSAVKAAAHAACIAEFLGIDVDDVLPENMRGQKIDADFVKVARVDPQYMLGRMNADALTLPSGDERLLQLETTDEIRAAVGRLNSRLQTVIRCRFGLGDERPLSLEETGKRIGVTKERVRQIEIRARECMRLILEDRVSEIDPEWLIPEEPQ
jgi:RNA polymerase sigma factor (sigma-70 family)